jgi:hypothetical protein
VQHPLEDFKGRQVRERGARQKGCDAIATVMQERGEVVCKDMVMRGALSALEFFNDHQKQVLRVVGVFDG